MHVISPCCRLAAAGLGNVTCCFVLELGLIKPTELSTLCYALPHTQEHNITRVRVSFGVRVRITVIVDVMVM